MGDAELEALCAGYFTPEEMHRIEILDRATAASVRASPATP